MSMKLKIYYDRMNPKSKLKLTPKCPKKVDINKFQEGVEFAKDNKPVSKMLKRENYNHDFISGVMEGVPKLDIEG